MGARRLWLLRARSRGDLDRALAVGDVVVVGRGLLALASIDQQQTTAARLGGTLALASAALRHGWAVKMDGHQVEDGTTTEVVTLEHCCGGFRSTRR